MFQQQTAGNQITWLVFFTVTVLRFSDLTHSFLLGRSWVWFPIARLRWRVPFQPR